MEVPVNINRGKAYEDRVCLICKGTPADLSSYCKPCFKEFKSQLLEWSLQDHIQALNNTKLSDLKGKKLTVANLDKTFIMDLLDEEDKVIYRITPTEHELKVSIAVHEL